MPLDYSFIDQCVKWPVSPSTHPASHVVATDAHYPDIQAIIISGELDSITTMADGAAVAGAFGLSEPQAGSDPAAMSTTATRTAKGWRLDGSKQWITSGDVAGVVIVWAKTDPQAGSKGISTFIVEGGTPGFSAGKHEDKMGLRGSTTVPLLFDGFVCDGAQVLRVVGAQAFREERVVDDRRQEHDHE